MSGDNFLAEAAFSVFWEAFFAVSGRSWVRMFVVFCKLLTVFFTGFWAGRCSSVTVVSPHLRASILRSSIPFHPRPSAVPSAIPGHAIAACAPAPLMEKNVDVGLPSAVLSSSRVPVLSLTLKKFGPHSSPKPP